MNLPTHVFTRIVRWSTVHLLILLAIVAVGGVANAAVGPSIPNPAALKILDKVETKLLSVKSLSADFTWITDYPPSVHHPKGDELRQRESVLLKRPNLARSDNWRQKQKSPDVWVDFTHDVLMVSDGQKNWIWFAYGNEYQVWSESANGDDARVGLADPLFGYFDPSASYAAQVRDSVKDGTFISLTDQGMQNWEGKPYHVVEFASVSTYSFGASVTKSLPGGKVTTKVDIFIGGDALVHRSVTYYNIGLKYDSQLTNVVINKPIPAIAFAFKIPKGAHLPKPPPPLLADGTTAPDFTVNDPTGNPVHLSDFKGKVVVIDFWATWCGPCQESLPDTNKLAETYKGQNIVFLGVNTWDTDDAFKSWLPSHKALDAIQFVIDPNQSDKSIASSLYKVSGIPTQYVVDTKGDVAASFVGYSEGSPDLANAVKAALAVPVTVQPTP